MTVFSCSIFPTLAYHNYQLKVRLRVKVRNRVSIFSRSL